MTEKRFIKRVDCFVIPCFFDNGKPISANEVVECLNNLHEENIALRNDDTITDYEVQISKLITEKQRLTDTCNSLAETIEQLQNTNEELRKDNTELKEAMKRLMADMMTGGMR